MPKLSFAMNKHGDGGRKALKWIMAAALTIGLVPSGAFGGGGKAWADEVKVPEAAASAYEISVAGEGSIEIERSDGEVVSVNSGETATIEGEVGTYVTIHGHPAEQSARSVQRVTFDNMGLLAASDKEFDGDFTWWLTFDGTDKRAAYLLGTDEPLGHAGDQEDQAGVQPMSLRERAAIQPFSAGISTQSLDDPQVGDKYTGYGEITHAEIISSGGMVGYFTAVFSSGPLAGQGSYRTYCADHGKASLLKGADIWYQFTVTELDYENGRVYGEIYGEGLGEYVPRDGYQTITATSWFNHDFGGELELQKTSANASITSGNRCYSFEGIKYGVYADSGCTSLVTTLTLDANGYAKSERITRGTYYVKEISSNSSYALSDEVKGVEVGGGEVARLEFADRPLDDPTGLMVRKYDEGTGAYVPTGDAKLVGAEYTFEYIDGYAYSSQQFDQMKGSSAVKRTWVLRTDQDGYTDLRLGNSTFALDGQQISYKVSGDSFFMTPEGESIILPLGTVRIRETKAPEGYNISDAVYIVRVVAGGNGQSAHLEGDVVIYDPNTGDEATRAQEAPIRGGVTIYKRDAETREDAPQAPATWDGVSFEIVNRSAAEVTYDGVKVPVGGVVTTIEPSGDNGMATTGNGKLQYGTYGIREATVSDGYIMSDTEERTFEIRNENEMVVLDGDKAVYNQVIRGDLEFVKVAEKSSARLANVPFLVTNKDTGESHVVVTDANGQVKTGADWNKHTTKTNASDAAVDADGDGVFSDEEKANVDSSKLDCYAGTWFGIGGKGTEVSPDDSKGALPWGDYEIEELRVEQNKHYELIKTEVQVRRNGVSIDMGTLIDTTPDIKNPFIGTSARDGIDNDRLLVKDTEAVVIDRVEYVNLTVGEIYRLVGVLMDKATGEPVRDAEGNPVSVEKLFTPEAEKGFTEMTFSFDATSVEGDVVVFEKLFLDGQEDPVATHEDIDDYYQTVKVYEPAIGTTLTDGSDGDKDVVSDEVVTLVDTVAYKNLVPGKEYTVSGTLNVVSGEGEGMTVEPFCDANGDPIVSTATFAPAEANGTVDVTFEFSGEAVKSGMNLVAYEQVLRFGTVVAVHEDPQDPSQTVTVVEPSIGTMATDAKDGDKEIEAAKSVTVNDAVVYENLIPGREYVLNLTVMQKTDKGAVPLCDSEGKPCTAELAFTPEQANGVAVVAVTIDSSALAGEDLVMYEQLTLNGKLIASHEDPDDEGQTVHVTEPKIGTTATDKTDGDHKILASRSAVIVDEVAYTGLIPGEEYTLKGVIMDKDTGKPVIAGDREVRAEMRFTPNTPNGIVSIEFTFDASALGGKKLVVFEELYKDGEPVAEHKDIDDAAQTVEVVTPLAQTGQPTPTPAGKSYAKTGADTMIPMVTAALLVIGGIAALAVTRRRKQAEAIEAIEAQAIEGSDE